MRPITLLGLTLIAAATSALPATAQAVVIDFEPLQCGGSGNSSTGGTYSEDGFDVIPIGGNPPHFHYFCIESPFFPGSTSLFFGQPETSARLEDAIGRPFDVASIDLAQGFNGGGAAIIFTGFRTDSTSVTQSFQSPTGGDFALATFN